MRLSSNLKATSHKPYLSKSRFMSGMQCELRLWNEVFDRDLMREPDAAIQYRFDMGTEVGEVARNRYPKGRLIGHDPEHFREAIEETQELLEDSSIPTLFEPAFQFKRVRCRVDVLQRLGDGGWRIVEVKSSTKPKREHVEDLALQIWVLRGCKIDVRDACVLTLDRDYVRGESLDVRKLFKEHPLWQEVQEFVEPVGTYVDFMKRILTYPEPPDVAMGDHCNDPYACPFIDHCSGKLPALDHPISEFWNFSLKQQLLDCGIEEIRDVPEDYPLSEVNRQIRKCVLDNRNRWRNRSELVERISSLSTPIRHLDFETIAPVVPLFEGTRPYQAIPFMFSVHRESKNGSLIHSDYLHEEFTYPRRAVAEQLIEQLGTNGSVTMYTQYEKTQIENLASEIPDLESPLLRIRDRLVDVAPFVRHHYYHPEFRGSFSLKSVVPVMGKSDYSDLEIDDGTLASIAYLYAMETESVDERERTFHNLREYCKRDTLATYKILESLRRRVDLEP